MSYTIENLSLKREGKILRVTKTEIEEGNTQLYSHILYLPRSSYGSLEEAGIQPYSPLPQYLLKYWQKYISYRLPTPNELLFISIIDPFEELEKYTKDVDLEFLKQMSIEVESLAPILVEVIHEIEKKIRDKLLNAKIEISVLRDELGDRICILIDNLEFESLDERYQFEDELEQIVWKIVESKKDTYSSQDLEKTNALISILIV